MTPTNSATTVPVELLKKYDRPGPRYTSYPTAPVWSDKIGTDDYREALRAASIHVDRPLAIYIHIPFCEKRCYYCGCNTCITRDEDSVAEYVRIMEREIELTAELLGDRNKVAQVHFGGGTPTYIGVDGMGRVLDRLDRHFQIIDGCEKSIEVDPRITTEEHLTYLAGRGFNRASLGVQDFDPEVQRACGRIQSTESVEKVLEICRGLNFKGINFDLIYGLPKQTISSFKETLDKTIAMSPDRIAVYSFAYLPSVKANQMLINEADLPSTDVKYGLFAAAIEKFTAVGYRQIGMDHFAKPTDELSLAQSDGRLHRNFMGYTVQSAPEMIGFGMSSIGYVNNGFYQNHSKINSYKNAVKESGFAVYRGKQLSQDDLIRQYLITSLMCNFSLDFKSLEKMFGISYAEYFEEEIERLTEFDEDSFLQRHEDRLDISVVGRTFVRNIAMKFDAYFEEQGQTSFSRTI